MSDQAGAGARLANAGDHPSEADPLLSTLLRLSGDTSLPDRPTPDPIASAAALQRLGIDFVVVHAEVTL